MTPIQQTRYDALLRRVADLKGAGSKVNTVLEELFPVLDVESVPGELLNLMGTDICMGGETRGSSATTFAKVQIFNPLGSGKLITVSTLVMTLSSTGSMRVGLVDAALATETVVNRFRDTRRGIVANPVAQIRNGEDTVATPDPGVFRVIANTTVNVTDPNGVAVLSPGFGLEVSHNAFNLAIWATFFWRERVAEPSELSI